VIVNTCGFLDSARVESLEAIGEALNENGRVIVTGCLGTERQLVEDAHPAVLAITGPQQYEAVVGAVHRHLPPVARPFEDLVPTPTRLTPRHYAYLKISEGCSNRCSFCIIPHLRGALTSRPAAGVVAEAERLVADGVKELLVISQDTSAYGRDIKYAASTLRGREIRAHFQDLTSELAKLGVWVRLHYVYPYPHVDQVIELMADGGILPYLDIPFQHASPTILKAMRRPDNEVKTLDRIRAWRRACPDLAIRSSFIVGFPGETEGDFEMLLDWIEAAGIDRVGCFKYEPVAGAASNALPGQVPEPLKQERHDRLMAHAQALSAERLAAKRGRQIEVLVDQVDGDGTAVARSQWDAPEIDGQVFVPGAIGAAPGDLMTVTVTGSDDYDLMAVPGGAA